jgi:hypothetical protein
LPTPSSRAKNLNDVFSSLLKTLEKAAINAVFASSFFNAPGGSGGLSPALHRSLASSSIPGKNAEGTDNCSWRP